MLSFKISRNFEGEITIAFTPPHAELVSAPHMLSILQADNLSCGVLKQVQDDFLFYNLSWGGTKNLLHYKSAMSRTKKILRSSSLTIVLKHVIGRRNDEAIPNYTERICKCACSLRIASFLAITIPEITSLLIKTYK
jgi:hypothetical protein